MMIRYIPNDPRATAQNAPVTKAPRVNRGAGVARLKFAAKAPDEGRYAPGTPEFLYWQSREAALAALEAFEGADAAPLKAWAPKAASPLALEPDAGEDLNAYYDRKAVRFFHAKVGRQIVYSGASTDVVAHEVGHAILDALRPDLWDVQTLEAGALHESFGDCVAVLTALSEPSVRTALTAKNGLLGARNFAETTAEELSWAIGRKYPRSNAATARHAWNEYRWALPQSLPTNGGPGVLIAEVHSFSQVFTGCFYDLIVALYAASSSRTSAALLAATRRAAKLLFDAVRVAPVRSRLFKSVGESMLGVDQATANGASRDAIVAAFAKHDVTLTRIVPFAPSAVLSGKPARRGRHLLAVGPATTRDLRSRLGLTTEDVLAPRPFTFAGAPMVELRAERGVDLSGLAPFLRGVRATAQTSTVVGESQGSVARMTSLPDTTSAERETLLFVRGLVEHGAIAHGALPAGARGGSRASVDGRPRRGAMPTGDRTTSPRPATHAIVERSGERVLVRTGFACGCGACRARGAAV